MGAEASRGPGARIAGLAWSLLLVFAAHEAEEWNILAWYQRHYPDIPDASDGAVRLGLAAYVAVAFAWVLVATRLPPRATAIAVLPLAMLLLANAVQHVYWTVHFAAYGPGVLTAVTLLAPVAVVLVRDVVRERLAPLWYVMALAFLNLPTVVTTITGDGTVRTQLRMVNDLGAALARLF